MKLSFSEFKNSNHKRLTLLGMSGVGKTHLAKLLSHQDKYFHYSSDYRIGAEYLNDKILGNIKNHIKQDKWLKDLLDKESISIQNHITFDNLSSVSAFLGKAGNPELGGTSIDTFIARQMMHLNAEIKTMLDVPKFIKKAKAQGFNHFINDAGGSLCELDNEQVYQTLSDNTVILYIRASKTNEIALIKRAQTHPKPLYYQANFLKHELEIYLQENQLIYIAQINPNKFVRWVFPRLLEHRKPKYEAIAKKYGYIIDNEDLYQCRSANEIFELIYRTMN
ncbi:ATPase [Candidatus Vesicomyidisocius sp. SY067_SCS001]|uniref:ATPase n=1 Tax=Candidatus Vesicomyidisocius sp. SY067_SCS001 TaxID=2732590 RepID=UPI0016842A00|nr:ATPase [Candidatus Vesicomyosocius sp. SY067_SCS001]